MALDGASQDSGSKAEQLLRTKLYIPPVRSQLVSRPHLIRQLEEGCQRACGVTLISASAGSGKTSLVSQWLAEQPRPAAWLSLDEADSDTGRFLSYLIAALQTVQADLGEGISGLLTQAQTLPVESVLTALINEITAVPEDFILVLDDYHALDSAEIDRALTFLLEHLPLPMHMVITTREDPNLPLARLRSRNQLNELRVADLRFTSSETAQFLREVMGLQLSPEDIAALEARTEGWIAGLQLAAISMRGRKDLTGFIENFAGDHRYVVDYLVEEVLCQQPEPVREFLLQTSILDRLSGPLCDAVTDQQAGSALLDTLERGNLFLIPLDDRRHWFRYHYLFADVLRARLTMERSEQIPVLHARASRWHEAAGSLPEAIRHALAARDFEDAARLVELAWRGMDRSRQSARWLDWVKALPDEVIRRRPVLSAGYAWALLDRGALEEGEAWLRDAEAWLAGSNDPEPDMPVADREEFQALPASISSAHAYISMARGDMPATVDHSRRALELLPGEDDLRRGIPASLLGLAAWAEGDLESAERSLEEAMRSFQNAGNILFAITGAFVLADVQATLGCLRQAFETYQRSVRLAAGGGKFVLGGTADLHTGIGDLFVEQNDLESARAHLRTSRETGEQSLLPRWRFRWCLAQARLREAEGDPDEALALLEEAERHYVRGPVPDVRPIGALKARIWTAQGRLTEANAWVRQQTLAPDGDLSFLREFEHITLARVLIARYRDRRDRDSIGSALKLLERLLRAAEEGGRLGSVIEILVLQAVAHEAQKELSLALAALGRALSLAEPEGYVRTFVGEGSPMARLLSETASRGILPAYSGRLLAAFRAEGIATNGSSTSPAGQGLIEPLSPREAEVLQLIAQGLSNREIGERLFLALSTVKGYNRTLFNKLQVQRRTEAVARARELKLI